MATDDRRMRASVANYSDGSGGGRFKGQLSFSSWYGWLMSQISKMCSEDLRGSSPEAAGGGQGYFPVYPMSSRWEESSLMSENLSGMKRSQDSLEPAQNGLTHQLLHREVPLVPGCRALQDPCQAWMRHAPLQHRGADQADQEVDVVNLCPGGK